MKIFVPRLAVASLQPPQTALMPKFGGMPWGFPISRWPVCRECGSHMALLAQLPHDEAVGLDFGGDGQVLHLFQCPTGGCSAYAYDEGCTDSLILHCDELGDGLTEPPAGPPAPNPYVCISHTSESGEVEIERFLPAPMNGELWITGWDGYEDGVRAEQRDVYFDASRFSDAMEEEQEPFLKLQAGADDDYCRLRTKTGGFPYWNYGPTPPKGAFEFLLQIDTFLYVRGALPKPEEIGCDVFLLSDRQGYDEAGHLRVPPDKRRANAPWCVLQSSRSDAFRVEFANFGTDGTAYVFIDRAHSPPLVTWAWSR